MDFTYSRIYSSAVFDSLFFEGSEHFPTENKYYRKWAEEVDTFIKNIII
jgi:hypothetical protein